MASFLNLTGPVRTMRDDLGRAEAGREFLKAATWETSLTPFRSKYQLQNHLDLQLHFER